MPALPKPAAVRMTGRVAAVVPAAGRGERLGGGPAKALREIAGAPLLLHAVRALTAAPSVDLVVVSAPAESVETVRALLDPGAGVVAGGPTRPESVRCALVALPDDVDVVLVHDAARPFVPASVVEAVIAAVRGGHDAVVPVLPVTDTIKRVAPDGRVLATLRRDELVAVQTPQGFLRSVLVEAHQRAADDIADDATDDAVLVERLGCPVWTVAGAEEAFKVTTPADLVRAEAMLADLGR